MTNTVNQEIQILVNKYKFGNFKEVIDKCSILVKKYPKNDFLWNLAGLCFQKIEKNENAITSFQNAININQKNYAAQNNLAISLKNTRKFDEAEKILNKLIKINPNYLNAIVSFANLKNGTNFFDEAITYYKKALKIQNNLPLIYLNISLILQFQNKMDEAKEYLLQALKIDKYFCRADESLSKIYSYKDNENEKHLTEMLKKLDNEKLNDYDKIRLNFSIGKAFEDKKEFEKSFEYFETGNNLKKSLSKSSIKFYKQKAVDLKDFFSNFDFNKIDRNKDKGNKIFILGLPRSGTTLLERIISSHPKVSSISEIGFFYDEITKNLFLNHSLNKGKVDSLIQKNLDKKLNDIINCFNIKSEFVIDKTLLNFWYVGFLKIFFPNSKIIHSYRNPKDNCLSIYKNLIPTNERWPFDQEEIGEYFLIYKDLMNFWNKIFKNQIYNSKYENLVNENEKYTKEIISFCNLQWDDKCLNHHKNNNPIKTLSINQANKAIYNTSIDSSKFYKKKLSKLFKTLDELS